ncbi:MAG: NAD(P)/FAD-dependent oxidoreductase [Planctomycetaceae bacterium]|nr:NAD(P)/FAD-dependent oxidoreductase [Planctomycetaceae bacterium]
MAKKACIIGNGGAAVEACRGLRESGFDGDIDVFALGSLPPYNPMLTSYYAAGKIPYAHMFPYGASDTAFGKYRARVHRDSPAERLFARERRLVAAGEEFLFDTCCIASGASPIVPPIPGATLPGVHAMRTVEDAVAVREAMDRKPRSALVVGASMVGIKLVELFWKAGMEVTLADLAERIFPLAAHPDCSRVIEDRLVDKGIDLRFGCALERVDAVPGGGLLASFKDSTHQIAVDIVILAIGVRANLGFVNRDELEARQGVLVDPHMQTNVPGVYAAGDCAQGMNLLTGEQQIIGLWANARNQGFTAGCNMAGASREYAGEILHNITHFMGMDFVGIGDVGTGNSSTTEQGDGWFRKVFYRDGQVVGANFVDSYTEAGVFKNALVKQALRGQALDKGGTTLTPLQNHLLQAILKR